MFASKDFFIVVAALAMMTVPECFAQHKVRPLPGAPDVSMPFAFSYRSFWPKFAAMGQFRDAGVNTVVPVQNRILTYFFASPDTALFEMQR